MTDRLELEATELSFDAMKAQGIQWLERNAPDGYVGFWGELSSGTWHASAWTPTDMPGDGPAFNVWIEVREARGRECHRCLQVMTVLERMTSVSRHTVPLCDVCREIMADV